MLCVTYVEDCVRRILKPAYSAVGMSDEKVCVAYVEVDGEFEDNTSNNESIKPKFYSRDEVAELLETEEFASRT